MLQHTSGEKIKSPALTSPGCQWEKEKSRLWRLSRGRLRMTPEHTVLVWYYLLHHRTIEYKSAKDQNTPCAQYSLWRVCCIQSARVRLAPSSACLLTDTKGKMRKRAGAGMRACDSHFYCQDKIYFHQIYSTPGLMLSNSITRMCNIRAVL